MEETLQGFVSASDAFATAELFSTLGDDGGTPRVFTFDVAPGTLVIRVDEVLPETWQCAVEKETIIGPGAVFVLKDDEKSIISVSPSTAKRKRALAFQGQEAKKIKPGAGFEPRAIE